MSKKTVEDSWGNGGRPRTFSKSMVSKSKKLIYDDCFCFGLGLIRLISNGGARGVRYGSQEYILRTPQEYTLPGVRLPPEEYLLPGRSTPGNPSYLPQNFHKWAIEIWQKMFSHEADPTISIIDRVPNPPTACRVLLLWRV